MAKKINKNLLNEELKRFKLLSEYSFYTEEPKKNDDDLILGSNLDEADEETPEEPVDDSKTAAGAGDDTESGDTGDAGGDFSTAEEPTEEPAEEPAEEPELGDEAGADLDFSGGDEGGDEGGTEDEMEIDVTQLVDGSKEAKKSADLSLLKSTELLNKFNDLERKVAAMDTISSKIDTLEKEIVKRNPTPVEKLEMRSMDSFPYNIKLTDYWKDVDGYDANGQKSSEPKEYVLTKNDIDDGETDASIKKTFDVPEDYEEEDIYP